MLDKNDFMIKSIALESEKKANQSKSAFLSRMSHDMRTPLNGITGLLKINENHFDDIDLVKENHKKMQIAADYLLSLINEVLQMSKIEEGSIPLTQEVIDFTELTNEIIVIMEQRARDRGIQMQFRSNKQGPQYPFLYGSPVHLRQIFLNIYGNCIKYNRPGGTITTVSGYTEAVDGITTYECTITDTGIGMGKEFLEHIFEPFSQEKDDARSMYQGVGLGMAIVKGLIDKMGGSIEIKSEEGVGSSFIIRIPFKIASAPIRVKEQKTEATIENLNLLLAEDNELNAEIAEMLLSDEGAKITVVKNGLQAVKAFQENPCNYFDAILMDIMMPVMDGLTAAKTIRAAARADAKTIPIIAMTANAFQEDQEQCYKAGMNAHLAKPLNMEKVIRTIYEQCSYKLNGRQQNKKT